MLPTVLCANSTHRARASGLLELDVTTSFAEGNAAIDVFCNTANITRSKLLDLGRAAQARGCAAHDAEKFVTVSEDVSAWIFRRTRPDWDRVDGTMPQGQGDTDKRYKTCVKWTGNSCAVDSAIFVGLMLDAGRVQVDQISPHRKAQLPPVAAALRAIVATAWGNLTQAQRNSLRKILREELEQLDPDRFAVGDYCDVTEVMLYCFNELPQLSWTYIRASRCTDGALIMPSGERAQRRLGITYTRQRGNLSVAELMNAYMSWEPLTVADCDHNGASSHAHTRGKLVLDRMPPVLYLNFPEPVKREADASLKMFESFEVIYTDTRGQQSIEYEAIGAVFMMNSDHFIVRWVDRDNPERIVTYNDMTGPGVVRTTGGDWFKRLNKSAGVLGVFYRQC